LATYPDDKFGTQQLEHFITFTSSRLLLWVYYCILSLVLEDCKYCSINIAKLLCKR